MIKKVSVNTLQKYKDNGEKFSMLTAYDYSTAKYFDEAGIDVLLVGDSLSMVILGYDSTTKVSMEEMTVFTKAVARGANRAFIVADLPFMSYHTSLESALTNAGSMIKNGANAVKIEGCSEHILNVVKRCTESGIPVMGHLGFTPQFLNTIGGYNIQGKSYDSTLAILEQAKKLEQAGCVKLINEELYRNPLDILKITDKEPLFELSPDQQKVYEGIKNKITPDLAVCSDKRGNKTILLHGVTASGKTEVYFKLIDDTIKSGKNVLFLAPEIALASQLTKRLAKKFGTKDVAIWHSSISDGERYDVWQKLYKDEIKILAGARSAVFAPLQNIGLIIIDEEHESAYKQTSPAPRYDAKVVAQKLAEFHNCPLLLGSATPDISVYYRAVNSGNLFELKKRYNDAKVPPVYVINMQEYGRAAYRNVISKPLQTAINETLENNQQVILLINRRGFSTFTQCQACGHVIECPNCAIPMIWHAKDRRLKCHYCNHTESFPDTCPQCGSNALKNSGTGTQKIEQYIKELYPDKSVERIDSDILVRKGEHVRLLERFQKGDIDILVGTQMIAKGLDNPNVTLVGVISADASFNLPDFRASERGFQLLTQVAGRAGRGDFAGKVFFQTYNPEYYALESAKSQNYNEFYAKEIIAREEFDYPPFSKIVRLVLSSENNFRAEKSAQEIALRLSAMIEKYGISERIEVLGPTNCVIERINGQYRFQILIKNKMDEKGHRFISSFLNKITMPKDIKLTIDVDQLDIL